MFLSQFPRRFALLALLIGLSLGLAADSESAAADEAQSTDDGWRRTAEGWRRVEQLQAESWGIRPRQPDRFITDELTRPRAARWDFHPGVLALGQILIVAAAYAAVRHQPAAARTTKHGSGCESSLDRGDRLPKAA
jgi:hypothetical protein